LGALFAQQAGAEGCRDPRPDVDDAEPFEREGHSFFESRWCSAKTSFIEPFCLRACRADSAVSVFETNWWTMKWYFHASRLPMASWVWFSVSLTDWAVIGGTKATLSAISLAAAASSERGTTLLTRPKRHASGASIVSPVSRNSLALRMPSSHGSTNNSTPAPVMRSTG